MHQQAMMLMAKTGGKQRQTSKTKPARANRAKASDYFWRARSNGQSL